MPRCSPPGGPLRREPTSLSASRRDIREALLDLAYDVSSYLRHHARATVRVSAALLLAASLAACGPSAPSPVIPNAAVQPLSQEIRLGLPTQPGRYSVVPGSLGRDAQGVYHFAWNQPSATTPNLASASLVQLAQGAATELEVPPQGNPTLYLPPNTGVPLVNSANDLRTPVASSGGYGYPLWYPFYGGYRGLGYYDPPTRTVVGTGAVNGATISTSPAPPSQRAVGLARAVSGQAGGTGSGVAASNKSGASTSAAEPAGVTAPKSSGFSGGKGGAATGGASS